MKIGTHVVAGVSGGLMAAWACGPKIEAEGSKLYMAYAAYGLIFFVCHILPDIDLLSRRRGGIAFLKSHRGMTHSILFNLAAPWAVGAVMFAFQQGIKPYLYGALVGTVGGAFHLVLDVTNPYPVRLFWPLKKRVSLDLVYFRDPWILLMLVMGFFWFQKPDVGAIICGLFIFLVLCLRLGFAIYVRRRFPFFQRHLGREKVQKVAFIPDPWQPWAWKVTILTDDAIHTWNLDVLAGRAVDRERFDRREAGVVRRARAHELVRALDEYTPFFYLTEEQDSQNPDRTVVNGKDMRFYYYGDENPFRIKFTYEGNKLVEGYFL